MMKIFSWLQRKRKVLFLISLPCLPEFEICRERVLHYTKLIKDAGADVFDSIDEEHLQSATKYDIVIVVAHHSDNADSLLTKNGELMMDDFISYIPTDFKGVMDFSSCFSATAVSRIKERCPNCLVQSTGSQTALLLRMFLYPIVIKYVIENRNADYHEVYKNALNEAMRKAEERSCDKNRAGDGANDSMLDTHLGDTGIVSVLSPRSVKREVPFLVQVRCSKKKDSSKVILLAKKLDKKTREVESFELPNMNKGDLFGASISVVGKYSNHVTIDDTPSKVITIKEAMPPIVFCLTVDEDFPKEELMCRVMLEHNREPFGDCYISLSVTDENKIPAEVSYILRDKINEQMNARKMLVNNLELRQYQLKEMIASTTCVNTRQELKSDLNLCEKCIQIVCDPRIDINKQSKLVFVSSTSDLCFYRQIVKKAIEECKLAPEMYENWPQTSLTPADECCRRVMASGAMLCILGSNYGSLENSLGMSMTELEFRTASLAGIPILTFIVDPLNDSSEPDELSKRQCDFINNVKDSRILRFFDNEKKLYEETKIDLKAII